ncbi:MAG TPA: HAMP domain-containing sensor histidine kinase [Gaiellaceae bacterium]
MKTGSLRARVIVTTLALLAVVLAAVVTATTLAYRARLDGDLRDRLTSAGRLVERTGSAGDAKPLIAGLALEGIATRFGGSRTTPPLKGPRIETRGSLLVLDEFLSDGTRVSFTASRASIDHAVTNLLLVELLAAGVALVLAALLVIQGTRTALRPLSTVIETATRIAHGDYKLRLNPSRTDTELGSLAAAFDRMLDALETAIDEARASEAATRRFLADASHELRNPIAALQASVETLLREQPERPERDRLEAAAARDSERLGRLVGDLLGLARLEARPSRAPVDLAAIAHPLVDDAQARAPDAAITLSADDDTTVRGDPDALERALRNLIDNALAAIRPAGRIDVDVRRRNGYVQARIADDGPGVPEDQRHRIFERFVRLDPGKPGHGLGLAIARRIAQQHDGDLTCDSTASGATFTLRLPAEP